MNIEMSNLKAKLNGQLRKYLYKYKFKILKRLRQIPSRHSY